MQDPSPEVSIFGPHTHISPVSGTCVLTGLILLRKLLLPCLLPSELAVMRRSWERWCGCVQPVRRWHRGDTVDSNVPRWLCSSCLWLAPKQNLSYILFFQ